MSETTSAFFWKNRYLRVVWSILRFFFRQFVLLKWQKNMRRMGNFATLELNITQNSFVTIFHVCEFVGEALNQMMIAIIIQRSFYSFTEWHKISIRFFQDDLCRSVRPREPVKVRRNGNRKRKSFLKNFLKHSTISANLILTFHLNYQRKTANVWSFVSFQRWQRRKSSHENWIFISFSSKTLCQHDKVRKSSTR